MRRREPRYDVPKKAPDGPLRLVQELLNTGDREHGREWLDSAEALHRWFLDRDLAGRSDRITRADLARTLETREALRELVRTRSGTSASEEAMRTLDEIASAAQLTMRFDAGGAGLARACRGGSGGSARPHPRARPRSVDRRQLGAAEGVPELQLGVLRLLPQPLCEVVLDAALRQPGEGARLLPPAERADPVVIRWFTNC